MIIAPLEVSMGHEVTLTRSGFTSMQSCRESHSMCLFAFCGHKHRTSYSTTEDRGWFSLYHMSSEVSPKTGLLCFQFPSYSFFLFCFLHNCRKVSCQFLRETLNLTAWAAWSVKETNMWDINVTRTVCCVLVMRMSWCVCGHFCKYPVCVRHEETLRHPWASGRIVVHQVGVSSLGKKLIDTLIFWKCNCSAKQSFFQSITEFPRS